MTSTDVAGANSYRGKRSHGLGWVPWAALLGILALAALTFLIIQNVTDENDQAGLDLSDNEIAANATNADNRSEASNANAGASANTTNNASTGVQVPSISAANGSNLFELAANNRLNEVQGQAATAQSVGVTSVVANEGFWVGRGGANELFVYLTPQARGTGESIVQVRAGQNVDLRGQVVATPSDPASLGVTEAEGAAKLRTQGGFLSATSLTIR